MNLNEIPLIGQTHAVHAGDCSAVVTCLCKPGNSPFLIPSTQVQVMCNACKGIYRLMGAMFDAQKSSTPIVAVAQVGRLVVEDEPQPTVN